MSGRHLFSRWGGCQFPFLDLFGATRISYGGAFITRLIFRNSTFNDRRCHNSGAFPIVFFKFCPTSSNWTLTSQDPQKGRSKETEGRLRYALNLLGYFTLSASLVLSYATVVTDGAGLFMFEINDRPNYAAASITDIVLGR